MWHLGEKWLIYVACECVCVGDQQFIILEEAEPKVRQGQHLLSFISPACCCYHVCIKTLYFNLGIIYSFYYIYINISWCNGYCCQKWIRQLELKSRTRLFAFHNTLGKGMNPTILPSGMSKIVEQTGLFSLGMASSLGEVKFWIQICWNPL